MTTDETPFVNAAVGGALFALKHSDRAIGEILDELTAAISTRDGEDVPLETVVGLRQVAFTIRECQKFGLAGKFEAEFDAMRTFILNRQSFATDRTPNTTLRCSTHVHGRQNTVIISDADDESGQEFMIELVRNRSESGGEMTAKIHAFPDNWSILRQFESIGGIAEIRRTPINSRENLIQLLVSVGITLTSVKG